jgi:TRAP-type C4-dicarboxylate transport system permease small subunit
VAIALAALAGLILLAFEVAEITIIDQNVGGWLPVVVALQSVYSALGLTMVGLALRLLIPVRRRQPARVWHASTW